LPTERSITLDDLRRFAIARSLFAPTTLKRAIDRLGFVQADPIRAPARAQDLTLRHRVKDYRAGDLERRYATLGLEEDFFVNYGFVTKSVHDLMHPRAVASARSASRRKRASALLEFVRERGSVHPREVDDHFSSGTVTNYWGGSSTATTHLLNALHYHGLLRVVRREAGIRIYAAREDALQSAGPLRRDAAVRVRLDALVDVIIRKYSPLPGASLSSLVYRLRYAAPQWHGELKRALQRAKARLAHAQVGGVDWYWPAEDQQPRREREDPLKDCVRLLAPFDPVVWDRRRFELFWGWAYRFEAYTPAAKRTRGYYALPLLWRDHVIGWGNVSVRNGELQTDLGYIQSQPREAIFLRELEAELDRIRAFLNVSQI